MNTTTNTGNSFPSTDSDHPNPMDRNRSILWARYLVDSKDWMIVSTKVTSDQFNTTTSAHDNTMTSISVMDSAGNVAYEALIKPEGIVSNDLIAQHELETSTLFNAQPYSVIRESLIHLMVGKDVLAWDFNKQREILEQLDAKYNMPPHEWHGNSVSHQYARFLGKQEGNKPGYVMPKFKKTGVSAKSESLAVRDIIFKMASSSQYSDPLATGKPGWTAEFYRPKISASEKLKSLFSSKK